MNRVLALVEGQTEQTFVSRVLAPELGASSVFLSARIIGKPGRKGGIRAYSAVRREIVMLLREDPRRLCTTMFDFYGLPEDWPGRQAARSRRVPDRAESVESAMAADVAAEMGTSFDLNRFIPYIQLHEFEALLFASPRELAHAAQSKESEGQLQAIADEFGDPEAIDDGQDTHPSHRIIEFIPRYQKAVHGPIAAGRIGLPTLRQRCAHFARWIERLKELAPP